MATSPVPPHAMAVPWNLGLIEYTHPESRGADCHRSWNLYGALDACVVQYSFPSMWEFLAARVRAATVYFILDS